MKSNVKRLPRPARATISGLAVLLAICFAATFCVAGSVSAASVLSNYAIVSVGPNASIMMNSGPVTGKVLVGFGSTVSSAGGGNGQITGGVDNSAPTTGCGATQLNCFSSLATPPVVTIVPSTVGTQAYLDAARLSSISAALPPDQTFGAINGTQTITGTSGVNVINIASLHNPNLTLSGNASTIFVINVSGSFSTNRAITLQGITASQILWNFTGTGTVLQTSGGNTLYGTFLATRGGSFQFSSLNLTGALINTGGHIQFVSNSHMTFAAFTGIQQVIPEPSSLLLFGTGLVASAGLLRRKVALRIHSSLRVLGLKPIQVPGLAVPTSRTE